MKNILHIFPHVVAWERAQMPRGKPAVGLHRVEIPVFRGMDMTYLRTGMNMGISIPYRNG